MAGRIRCLTVYGLALPGGAVAVFAVDATALPEATGSAATTSSDISAVTCAVDVSRPAWHYRPAASGAGAR